MTAREVYFELKKFRDQHPNQVATPRVTEVVGVVVLVILVPLLILVGWLVLKASWLSG